MSKISKSTIYAIKWLSSCGSDIESIMNELSVTKKQAVTHMELHISGVPATVDPTDISPVATESTKINPKSLMITQTAGKRINNVAIMTGEASMLSDHVKKNQAPPSKSQTGIFRPRS